MTTATSSHSDQDNVTRPTGDVDESRLDRFGHERPRYDDINTPVIVLVGVISAIVTFLTIAFVEGLTYHWQNRLIKKLDYEVTNYRQVEKLDRQKAILEGDELTGILSLESVTDEVINKYQRQPGEGAGTESSPAASGDQENAPADGPATEEKDG